MEAGAAVHKVLAEEGLSGGPCSSASWKRAAQCAALLLQRSALVDRHVVAVFRAGVVRARADDLALFALLDHVRTPAGGTGDHEPRREHRRRTAHHVVARRAS